MNCPLDGEAYAGSRSADTSRWPMTGFKTDAAEANKNPPKRVLDCNSLLESGLYVYGDIRIDQ